MDVITFHYLIMVVSIGLQMQLMDMATTNLYGDLDSKICICVCVRMCVFDIA